MKAAITIGNFDGVHRGHRALVDAVTQWRRAHDAHTGARHVSTVVVTFDPHPAEVLKNILIPRLSSLGERGRLLESLGVDHVRVIPFTKDFSHMPARQFFDDVLLKDLHAAFVAVGENFYFGHNREGTPGKILDWCHQSKIPCQVIAPVEADGAPISSSRIRKLIEEGKTVQAARLLGRDYSISSEVTHGDKRGRQLGFPTANMLPLVGVRGAPCLPARGVYLSTSTIEGKTFAGVTNVGVKPTVHRHSPLVVETHLLDFDGDLYGKWMTVEFRDRLRDERKFAGLDELKQQIQLDVACARAKLKAD